MLWTLAIAKAMILMRDGLGGTEYVYGAASLAEMTTGTLILIRQTARVACLLCVGAFAGACSVRARGIILNKTVAPCPCVGIASVLPGLEMIVGGIVIGLGIRLMGDGVVDAATWSRRSRWRA